MTENLSDFLLADALELIESGINDIKHQKLVDAGKIVDLLLDLRALIKDA